MAAVAPPGNGGQSFNMYSGTSMATPHVAGLAALLMQLHGDWTPMMVKSALMTSAGDVLDGPNTDPSVVFGQGAGHVAPNLAASPGLVYDSGFNDWLAFLCGTTTGVDASDCAALGAAGYSLDPRNLNVASIGIGALAGSRTVTRVVTNVDRKADTYTPKITGLNGIAVSVAPASLRLDPGQRKAFKVTFTRRRAVECVCRRPAGRGPTVNTAWVPLVIGPIRSPRRFVRQRRPISHGEVPAGTGRSAARADWSPRLRRTDRGRRSRPTRSSGGLAPSPSSVRDSAGTTHAILRCFAASVTPGSDLDSISFKGDHAGGIERNRHVQRQIVSRTRLAATTTCSTCTGSRRHHPGRASSYAPDDRGGVAGNMTVTAPATATSGATATVA